MRMRKPFAHGLGLGSYKYSSRIIQLDLTWLHVLPGRQVERGRKLDFLSIALWQLGLQVLFFRGKIGAIEMIEFLSQQHAL